MTLLKEIFAVFELFVGRVVLTVFADVLPEHVVQCVIADFNRLGRQDKDETLDNLNHFD